MDRFQRWRNGRKGRTPPQHGLRASYQNYACRCEACCAAQATYMRHYRTQRPRVRVPRRRGPDDPPLTLAEVFEDQILRVQENLARSTRRIRDAHVSALLTDHGSSDVEVRR